MPPSTFAAGTSPVWIALQSAYRFLPVLAIIYLTLNVLIATPLRVKHNHYPRFLRGGIIAVTLLAFTFATHSYYTAKVAGMKQQEKYIAAHPTKVLKRSGMARVVDVRYLHGEDNPFHLLVKEGEGQKALAVTRAQWVLVSLDDTVTIRYSKRVNPYIKSENDKYWRFGGIITSAKETTPTFSYNKKRSERVAKATVLKAYSIPTEEVATYWFLLKQPHGRFVQQVDKHHWLKSRSGDQLRLDYKRVEKRWKLTAITREGE